MEKVNVYNQYKFEFFSLSSQCQVKISSQYCVNIFVNIVCFCYFSQLLYYIVYSNKAYNVRRHVLSVNGRSNLVLLLNVLNSIINITFVDIFSSILFWLLCSFFFPFYNRYAGTAVKFNQYVQTWCIYTPIIHVWAQYMFKICYIYWRSAIIHTSKLAAQWHLSQKHFFLSFLFCFVCISR